MVVEAEPRRRGHVGQLTIEAALERVGDLDILHRAAPRADEVVVVTVGQALGQLEARPLAGGHDPLHDPDPFQQHEVAVGRALRQVGVSAR